MAAWLVRFDHVCFECFRMIRQHLPSGPDWDAVLDGFLANVF
jgi:hypothetical protein